MVGSACSGLGELANQSRLGFFWGGAFRHRNVSIFSSLKEETFYFFPSSSLIFVMCHPSRGEPLCDCGLAAISCGSVQVVSWILLHHQCDCYTGQGPERRPHIPYHHRYTVREIIFVYSNFF